MGSRRTHAGADGRTRNRYAPGRPARPGRGWPGDRPARPSSAAQPAGTRPPGPGQGSRQAHRWCHGPAAGPAPADPRRRPPRGVRTSGRRRWPRPPRASRRAARPSSPGPGGAAGLAGLRRAPGVAPAPGTPRAPGPPRSARCFPAPTSGRRAPGQPAATGRGHRPAQRPGPAGHGPVETRSSRLRSSSASSDRSMLGRSGRLLRSRLVMLPSKRRGRRMRYTAPIHARCGHGSSRRRTQRDAGLRQGRGQPP